MKPPIVAMVKCVMLCSLPRYSSTAAMAAAAPPPMPLYSAIICGMSVMATRLPLTQCQNAPGRDGTDHQHQIEGRGAHEGQGHDRGEHHPCARPADAAHGGDRRTHALEAKDEQRRRHEIGELRQGLNSRSGGARLRSFLSAGGDEHLQHALGHHIAAHGIARGENHADDADDPQLRRVGGG